MPVCAQRGRHEKTCRTPAAVEACLQEQVVEAHLRMRYLALCSRRPQLIDAAGRGHVRDVDGGLGEARDGKRAADRLLLDVRRPRPRKAGCTHPALFEKLTDEGLDHFSVLAVD